MASNMAFYDKARSVPEDAKKQIGAGRLKGMTDINPMWRIKKLTEMFGPCGLGWWYEITDKRVIEGPGFQHAAFVDILLYYKDPVSGERAKPIPVTGGASFVAQEKNGLYMSDECFKMALTDAISVACKALGMGADVYWAKDRTKYSGYADEAQAAIPRSGSAEAAQRAGSRKLEQVNAELAKARETGQQAATGRTMASEDQKQELRALVNVEQMASCTKMYGPSWERMPASAAKQLIDKIKAERGGDT